MTAIALLNSENDPHVVADTLLSTDGGDPNKDKNIWLPALGYIHSEWENEDGLWHIPRLGRKTFAIPISSGLLAFAGHCQSAFNFWNELSTHFYSRQAYDSNYSITKDRVDSILKSDKDAYRFSLLGMVKDDAGELLPVIHKPDATFETKNYGVCHVAGSGSTLIKDIIIEKDKNMLNHNKAKNISLTEDLAEHISAEMLYRESDINNGLVKGTPIDCYCGGFYEWYGIRRKGTKVLQPRADMSILLTNNGITITRLHISEQHISQSSADASVFSHKYPVFVFNFVSEFINVSYTSLFDELISLSIREVYGVMIDSTFTGYENRSDYNPRLSGSIQGEIAEKFFGSPVKIKRIRLFVNAGERTHSIGFVNPVIADYYVKIQYVDDRFVIIIDGEVKEYILKKALSSGFI
ncbi:hypothetical protein ABRP92_11235 [Pectobacterium aroidearum]|uniref:hypothetical protein n=1 Tax=Pectobacterium aroidearum TaxID=1201031 RepID=UPI0032EFBBA8